MAAENSMRFYVFSLNGQVKAIVRSKDFSEAVNCFENNHPNEIYNNVKELNWNPTNCWMLV